MSEDILKQLSAMSEQFQEVMKRIENEQEEFWNSLDKDQQLKAFCAVMRRLYKGELEDKGSYRHVLYDTFGFGTESYAQAQDAGFLAIHNSIFDVDHEFRMLESFCEVNKIEDATTKIRKFLF